MEKRLLSEAFKPSGIYVLDDERCNIALTFGHLLWGEGSGRQGDRQDHIIPVLYVLP